VQQKAIKIVSERRVHTLGGESLGITAPRHGVRDFTKSSNREAEKAANQILSKAKPKP